MAGQWQSRLSIALIAMVAAMAAVVSCRPEIESTTWAAELPARPITPGYEIYPESWFYDVALVVDWHDIHPPAPVYRELSGAEIDAGFISLIPRYVPEQLSELQLRAVMGAAGVPESLHEEALSVGWCESRFVPAALGDGGQAVSIWQVHRDPWGDYTGTDPESWHTDLVTAAAAMYDVYLYDLARGNEPWQQWSCKPTTWRNWP